jgi:hypothetical protein
MIRTISLAILLILTYHQYNNTCRGIYKVYTYTSIDQPRRWIYEHAAGTCFCHRLSRSLPRSFLIQAAHCYFTAKYMCYCTTVCTVHGTALQLQPLADVAFRSCKPLWKLLALHELLLSKNRRSIRALPLDHITRPTGPRSSRADARVRPTLYLQKT